MNPVRGLATSAQTAKIHAGLLLSRIPIVTRDVTAFENAYYTYQSELQSRLMWTFPQYFYFRKGSIAERNYLDAQRGPVVKQPNVWFPKGVPDVKHGRERRTRQNIVIPRDETKEGDEQSVSRPVKPNSRITKADELNDVTSLERKLSRTLYLLIQDESSRWKFPAFDIVDQPLHITAETGLRELMGESIKTFTVSNTPTCVLKYADVAVAPRKTESPELKEYLIKSHILAGQLRLNPSKGVKAYSWLTKEEMKDLMEAKMFQQVAPLLSDV